MTMHRAAWFAAAFLAAAGAAQAQTKTEVIHWWTSGGESAAVRVFAERFQAAGGIWVDTAIAGGQQARTAGINRIVGGNPPAAMQFNTGKQFDELVESEMLRDVDDDATRDGWKDKIPPGIARAVTREGKIYAVPVNIHGQHWLWTNTKVLADAGVAVPNTWPDVIAAGPKLKAAGIIPLALGGQPWQERLVFSAVLSGQGGSDLFRKIYGDHDAKAAGTPEFLAVAQTYGALRDLVDQGSPGRNWNDATALVITGKAAMQMMGDWAKGEFSSAGLTAGKEYDCTLLGEAGVFVMGGDVFVFPQTKDKAVRAEQDKLAHVMLDSATQIAFNTVKGSVPVRLDVDTSGMDACARKGAAAVADPARQLEAMELLATPDLTGQLQDIITQYWNNKGMDAPTFVARLTQILQSAS